MRCQAEGQQSADRAPSPDTVKAPAAAAALGRRSAMLGMAAAAVATAVDFSAPAEGVAKETAQVGTYLPKADIDGFNLFVPDRSKTPVRYWVHPLASRESVYVLSAAPSQ